MAEWSVLVEYTRSYLPAEKVMFDLAALLDEYSAVVAGGDGHGVSVRLTVHAASGPAAVASAVTIVGRAASKLGAGAVTEDVEHVEATEWSRFERDLAEAAFPDILGSAEVAELLEVSKQRLTQLSRRADFPVPVVRLASGPVWVRAAIEAFLEGWERKPGRPAHITVVDEHGDVVESRTITEHDNDEPPKPRTAKRASSTKR